MKKLLSTLPAYLCMLLFLSACELFCDCEDEVKEPCLFSYDSVAYTPNGTGQDQIISPTFENTKPEGTFSATPAGLAIDSLTGNINLNTSQSTTEYTVVFTLRDGTTTCETKIYISEPLIRACDLRYASAIYYPNAKDKILVRPEEPFNDTAKFEGRFSVYPQGLDIDPATGVFNVNTSEAGLKYTVTYESADKTTRCQTEVTIAGIDYPDTFIDFDESKENDIVFPTLNGNDDPAPIQDGEFGSEDVSLVFVPGGGIDVRATLINLVPQGAEQFSQEFEIQYSIPNENGERIDNSVAIVIYWFANEDDEQLQELLDFIGRKQRSTQDGRLMHRHGHIVTQGKL